MTATRAIGWFFGAIINRNRSLAGAVEDSPNVLTFLGLVINIWAAWLFAAGSFRWAGVVVIGAGIFDMVDGRVARATNQVTRFGGFFDSVMDRYSDLALLMGLLVYYASINRFFYIVLTAIVMTGSVMISYTRARAENAIPKCKVGFLERPERVVLIIIGALFDRMAPVLVGDRGALQHHRDPPHDLHLPASQTPRRRPIAPSRPPVIPRSILQNHVRHPQLRRVRDRERHILHAERLGEPGRHAVETQRGLSATAGWPLRNPASVTPRRQPVPMAFMPASLAAKRAA